MACRLPCVENNEFGVICGCVEVRMLECALATYSFALPQQAVFRRIHVGIICSRTIRGWESLSKQKQRGTLWCLVNPSSTAAKQGTSLVCRPDIQQPTLPITGPYNSPRQLTRCALLPSLATICSRQRVVLQVRRRAVQQEAPGAVSQVHPGRDRSGHQPALLGLTSLILRSILHLFQT